MFIVGKRRVATPAQAVAAIDDDLRTLIGLRMVDDTGAAELLIWNDIDRLLDLRHQITSYR